ncbi:hypothetical protein BC936DRAFT_140424 [Jimgerdemannia flammicorona]|uniref:Uncharacterized protein n=1 Tax=Jimgerdemannia flammicorona TaxID=994334 RepID=A0A433DGZ7_9FUNG|nr:hypothetical protein BC936DRAFT_140424 [Jimgerdemannia flammicorona]
MLEIYLFVCNSAISTSSTTYSAKYSINFVSNATSTNATNITDTANISSAAKSAKNTKPAMLFRDTLRDTFSSDTILFTFTMSSNMILKVVLVISVNFIIYVPGAIVPTMATITIQIESSNQLAKCARPSVSDQVYRTVQTCRVPDSSGLEECQTVQIYEEHWTVQIDIWLLIFHKYLASHIPQVSGSVCSTGIWLCVSGSIMSPGLTSQMSPIYSCLAFSDITQSTSFTCRTASLSDIIQLLDIELLSDVEQLSDVEWLSDIAQLSDIKWLSDIKRLSDVT